MVTHKLQPPKGFAVIVESADVLAVTYKSTGMGCILAFFILVVGSILTGFLFFGVSEPNALAGLIVADWWTPFAFAAGTFATVYGTYFVLFHVFGITKFAVTDHSLTISRHLFGLTWKHQIDRDDLTCIEQIKDGGEGDDSFPSWALRAAGKRNRWLLCRQPIEKSDWLGPVIANRLAIEYRPTDKRPGD